MNQRSKGVKSLESVKREHFIEGQSGLFLLKRKGEKEES